MGMLICLYTLLKIFMRWELRFRAGNSRRINYLPWFCQLCSECWTVLRASFSEIGNQDMSSSYFPSKTKTSLVTGQPIWGLVLGGKELELMSWPQIIIDWYFCSNLLTSQLLVGKPPRPGKKYILRIKDFMKDL